MSQMLCLDNRLYHFYERGNKLKIIDSIHESKGQNKSINVSFWKDLTKKPRFDPIGTPKRGIMQREETIVYT